MSRPIQARATAIRHRQRAPAVLALCLLFLAACGTRPPSSPAQAPAAASGGVPSAASIAPSAVPNPTPEPARLIAVGDIAGCDRDADEEVAALVANLNGMLATLGDHAYPDGTVATFADCYDPAWGPFLDRTRPAVGNHDLSGDGGMAYFRYFGEGIGVPGQGWYSYDIGDWHVIALNSNCELIACDPGSPQNDWLVDDLAASEAECTLAYMHHPLFSSGPHGGYLPVQPLWEALHEADADLVLAGHDHLYERFAPQNPAGMDDGAGIRQFTVGTGGFELYPVVRDSPNSEVVIDDAFGVLELTLHTSGYGWRFLTVDGTSADAGSGDCR